MVQFAATISEDFNHESAALRITSGSWRSNVQALRSASKKQKTKSTLKRQSKAGKMSIELKASWVHEVIIRSYRIQ